ncbi:hypothetical protein [Streptomyces sp. AC558_RSS880]|uniref:hypothetical protein n=1 Tax=Streptomyces sp. AC558_RSS880 TaxID=2823687 RepID=UPI001C214262|nr:hypothetical protein [Streptomyces sp. AC558_RSS880]
MADGRTGEPAGAVYAPAPLASSLLRVSGGSGASRPKRRPSTRIRKQAVAAPSAAGRSPWR